MIVFDASALVSAALKVGSVPERALLRAEEVDVLALSSAVDFLAILRSVAVWFEPTVRVTDSRDDKDNKYLELALAASAETIVSGRSGFTRARSLEGVRILSPADYLALT